MVPDPSAPFAAVLRRHRLAAGLTQEDLAERAQLSARAISDLERGVKRAPQWTTVDLLARALALSPADVETFRRAARPPMAQTPTGEGGAGGTVREAGRPIASAPGADSLAHASPSDVRYASNGRLSIAFQVAGNGPVDLLATPGALSHLEYMWQEPGAARYLHGLAAFTRLLLFDKRGTGMSDREGDSIPTLEERIDDMRAVMDAAGSQRAALLGWSEGGPMSILFAATYPQRTAALILYGAFARNTWAPDYPWRNSVPTPEALLQREQDIRTRWGTREYGLEMLETFAPSMVGDAAFERWWCTILRLGASPGAWLALSRMNRELDVRDVLSSIRVPTLVLHRRGERVATIGNARYLAQHIPEARLVELPGDDHLPWVGDTDAVLQAIEVFLADQEPQEEPPDRLLATILRLEIIQPVRVDQGGPTPSPFRDAAPRQALARYRGRQLAGSQNELIAAFDGPARALRCASAICAALQDCGVAIRGGVHAGECDVTGNTLTGLPLDVTARMARQATAGTVLVTSTVRDLVTGSGIRFRAFSPPAASPGSGRQLFVVEQPVRC